MASESRQKQQRSRPDTTTRGVEIGRAAQQRRWGWRWWWPGSAWPAHCLQNEGFKKPGKRRQRYLNQSPVESQTRGWGMLTESGWSGVHLRSPSGGGPRNRSRPAWFRTAGTENKREKKRGSGGIDGKRRGEVNRSRRSLSPLLIG